RNCSISNLTFLLLTILKNLLSMGCLQVVYRVEDPAILIVANPQNSVAADQAALLISGGR
ncbi:MAG: hypothetical protein KKE90_11245, partial [Actinobacteria bacterium]|nr:hypothetical protein [Actinomycetota bacterium]